MDSIAEEVKTPAECEKPEDVWFQITITIDPQNYKRLWDYAESTNSSISSIARASVLHYIKDLKTSSCPKRTFPQASAGGPL